MLYCYLLICDSFRVIGGSFPWVDFKIFNGYRYSSNVNVMNRVAELIFICFVIYYTVKEFRKFLKQKWEYFHSFFNIIEVLLIPLYCAMFGLLLVRWLTTARNIKTFKENPKDFVSFQYAATADEVLQAVIGLVAFLLNIKFLRLFQFAKTFFSIGLIMKTFVHPLLMFMVPFLCFFLLFAYCAHLGLGTQVYEYNSLGRTCVSQFLHLLGAVDFEQLQEARSLFGPLYYVAFSMFMLNVVFNVCIAIICEAIDGDYEEEYVKQAGDIQLVEYMITRLKRFVGRYEDGEWRDQLDEEAMSQDKYESCDALMTRLEKSVDEIHHLVFQKMSCNEKESGERRSMNDANEEENEGVTVENMEDEQNEPEDGLTEEQVEDSSSNVTMEETKKLESEKENEQTNENEHQPVDETTTSVDSK